MKIIFMGTPDFSVPCLERLVKAGAESGHMLIITQPDKPKGRGYIYTPPPVKIFAEQMSIPVIQPDSVKNPDFTAKLNEFQPDLIITAAYGKILPAEILKIPHIGCINVHASLLPLLRGANPIAASIVQGFCTTGVTTMIMDEGMDTGDMLLKSEVQIAPDMNFEELHNILKEEAAELLIKTLDYIKPAGNICDLKLLAVPQDSSKATYAPLMRKSDARINWSGSPQEIHNFVRGLYGWPVAWCMTEKGSMKIWKTKLPEKQIQMNEVKGKIITADENGLKVACGSGSLIIEELQFESQKRMKASEYIRGHASLESWILK